MTEKIAGYATVTMVAKRLAGVKPEKRGKRLRQWLVCTDPQQRAELTRIIMAKVAEIEATAGGNVISLRDARWGITPGMTREEKLAAVKARLTPELFKEGVMVAGGFAHNGVAYVPPEGKGN